MDLLIVIFMNKTTLKNSIDLQNAVKLFLNYIQFENSQIK